MESPYLIKIRTFVFIMLTAARLICEQTVYHKNRKQNFSERRLIQLRKFFSRIYFLIVSLLILSGGILIFLYICQVRPYVVQTGSMTPTIPVGSVCFVNQHISYWNIHEGDIIAFQMGESAMVTHRAVRIEESGITTKGDANRIEDAALVTEKNYVGKTIFWIPEAGNFVRYLRTKQGIIFLLSGAVVLILTGFLLDNDSKGTDKEENSP